MRCYYLSNLKLIYLRPANMIKQTLLNKISTYIVIMYLIESLLLFLFPPSYHLQSSPDEDAQKKGRDCLEKSLSIYVELYGEEHGCTALGYMALARCRLVPVQQRIGLLKNCLKIIDVDTNPSEYDSSGPGSSATELFGCNFEKAPNNKAMGSETPNNVAARRMKIMQELPEMPNEKTLQNLVRGNPNIIIGDKSRISI
jgi:hypothetical protein